MTTTEPITSQHPDFQAGLKNIAETYGLEIGEIWALWREYARACDGYGAPDLDAFVEWHDFRGGKL